MRGVEKVEVDRRHSEAVVIRRKGRAPGSALVEAVRRAGYHAEVIPTYQLTLECPNLGRVGGHDRVRKALAGVRGVRAVGFPERTKAIVYYDRRRTSARKLMKLLESRHLECDKQG